MSIVGAFTDLKKYVKPRDSANVSSVIFKAHRLTCSFLLCCSVLTTSRQFFGAPIHCMMGDPPPIPLAVFESYCFMRSTYSHRHVYHNESTTHQHDHAHPGLTSGLYGVRSSEVTYHNYYQWVCLLLVLQAAICYTPWVYWKAVERGRVGKLVEKVSKDPLTEKPLREQISGLGDFLINNSGWFNSCAFKLVLSQLMCLVLTISQLYLMDVVLGNQFLHLGKHLFTYNDLTVALNRVFPIVVGCDMSFFGHGAEVTRVSGLCTLPINIVNEKIYFILWVWYILLVVMSAAILIWEGFHLICPKLRLATLSRLVKRSAGSCRMVRVVNKRSTYGDFVLLQYIALNIDTAQMESLIRHIYENTDCHLPLHNRSHSASLLEPQPYPMQRILSNEKTPRGKEL